MKNRCGNRFYYKNVTFCEEWSLFENFLKDMGERPAGKSLDRVDNSLGYFKGNCRWATRREQVVNRKVTRFFEMNGLRMILSDWSKKTGIKESTLKQRIYVYGWPVERALSLSKCERG